MQIGVEIAPEGGNGGEEEEGQPSRSKPGAPRIAAGKQTGLSAMYRYLWRNVAQRTAPESHRVKQHLKAVSDEVRRSILDIRSVKDRKGVVRRHIHELLNS